MRKLIALSSLALVAVTLTVGCAKKEETAPAETTTTTTTTTTETAPVDTTMGGMDTTSHM